MHDTGTAATLAFETAAGRTLPAEHIEVSMPDMQSLVLTQQAIVTLETHLWGILTQVKSLASLSISSSLSSFVTSVYLSSMLQTLGSVG